MQRHDAEAERDRRQRDDRDHTYMVAERGEGDWEVVQVDLARQALDLKAERGEPTDAPEDPRPSLIRQIPPYGPAG